MKKNFVWFLVILLIAASQTVFAQGGEIQKVVYNNGISMGSALAIAISWSRNKSLLWAILHGIFSWFYVIYYYFTQHNK